LLRLRVQRAVSEGAGVTVDTGAIQFRDWDMDTGMLPSPCTRGMVVLCAGAKGVWVVCCSSAYKAAT